MIKMMKLSTLVILLGVAMFSCSKEEVVPDQAADTTEAVINPAAKSGLDPVVLLAGYTRNDLDQALQPFKAALVPLTNYISLSENSISSDLTISLANYAPGDGPTNVQARVLHNGSYWGAILWLTFFYSPEPGFPCTLELELCQLEDGSWQLENGCP